MNKYKLITKKGQGTFSDVLKAQSIVNKKFVAIKCMKQHYESIKKVNELKEIQVLRKLSPHPQIINLLEVLYDEPTGRLALVFELMDENLYEHMEKSKEKLSEQKVKNIMFQLLKSLSHMHKNGYFHRDIKPENVLISGDTIKLADFGSCKNQNSNQPHTEYISTRWYRAPECLLTDGFYNEKMDIWGMGCVMFEILTKKPLFPGKNELDQIDKIHNIIGTPSKDILLQFQKQASHIEEFNFIPNEPGRGIDQFMEEYSIECVDLVKKMLEYNYKDRITASKCLKHPFFKDLREKEIKKHQNNLSNSKKNLSIHSNILSQRQQSCQSNSQNQYENSMSTKGDNQQNILSSQQSNQNNSKLNMSLRNDYNNGNHVSTKHTELKSNTQSILHTFTINNGSTINQNNYNSGYLLKKNPNISVKNNNKNSISQQQNQSHSSQLNLIAPSSNNMHNSSTDNNNSRQENSGVKSKMFPGISHQNIQQVQQSLNQMQNNNSPSYIEQINNSLSDQTGLMFIEEYPHTNNNRNQYNNKLNNSNDINTLNDSFNNNNNSNTNQHLPYLKQQDQFHLKPQIIKRNRIQSVIPSTNTSKQLNYQSNNNHNNNPINNSNQINHNNISSFVQSQQIENPFNNNINYMNNSNGNNIQNQNFPSIKKQQNNQQYSQQQNNNINHQQNTNSIQIKAQQVKRGRIQSVMPNSSSNNNSNNLEYQMINNQNNNYNVNNNHNHNNSNMENNINNYSKKNQKQVRQVRRQVYVSPYSQKALTKF